MSDVEGHGRMNLTDDVAGHLSLSPEHYLDSATSGVEGLPFKKRGAVKADETDDVSGHDSRPGRTRE